ncbi:trypsin-like peptidase domain-containing protein [Streptomyces sp. URMC 129]|uniref:trypsin-like peptidase domain-containing protein n=1 Tax=Streptomyces sp. URMC 129 TaxID=3423407 RepID=UPI003F1DB6EC
MRPLGCGFLIDTERVLTCAHVVRPAWDGRGELWVVFPKAEELMARRIKVSKVTLPSDGDDETQDVAVLHLAETIRGGLAARLRRPAEGDLVGTAWWSFGFPDGVLGNSASGSVGEALAYGWIRLDTNELRYPVRGGYSGAAVWSPAYQAVVGMVGQAHSATGDARALTVRAITRLLPDQRLHQLTDWSLEAADEMAMNSWGWSLGTDPEAERHWRPRARGVSTEAERGFRFRGRTAALREIIDWIAAPPRRQVLVITGAPGSGKSAVLGRIITTADREVAASLPPDDTALRAPVGSISCAVHAKGKTALEVAREIACAASAPLPGQVRDLLPSLRVTLGNRPVRPFTLVIDALDEANTANEARTVIHHIVVPLAEACADLGVHVVVGARRRDDAGDLLGSFGHAARIVDLDAPEFSAPADLTTYALATLQMEGDRRSGNPYADRAVALPVAERIASLADTNFLVAGLVARAHGIHDRWAVDPREMSFPVTVDASLRDYLRLLPDVGSLTADKVLTPLAYAEAPGLTMALWQVALTALFDTTPSKSELFEFARSSAANFLLESAGGGPDGLTFRLFHQALNESLRSTRADVASCVSDERALAGAFITEGARGGWAAAPAYLLRSLAVHAGRGGMIDRLLEEDDYPLHADLRRLIPQVRLATTDKGRERARLLRQTPRAIDAAASGRAALFSVTEVQEHLGTTYRRSGIAAPYRALWSTATPSEEVAVFEGHTGKVSALCFLRWEDCGILASVSDDLVRLWDPATGDTVHTLKGNTGWIGALCAVRAEGRLLLAGAGLDGAVRLWDPGTGEMVRTLVGHDAAIDYLCTVEVEGRCLLASAGRDRRVRVWDPDTGTVIRTFRTRSHEVNGLCAIEVEGRPLLAFLTGRYHTRNRVRLWDPATGETVRTFLTRSSGFGELAAVSCEGRPLLAAGDAKENDQTVTLWDPLTGKPVRVLRGGQGSVFCLRNVQVGDRSLLAAGYGQDESGTVLVWDPRTGRKTHRLEGHGGWVGALCTGESAGETFLASAGEDRTVRLWDLDRRADPDRKDDVDNWVGSLCVLDVNGRTAVAGNGAVGTVAVRDAATGRILHRIDTLHARIESLCTTEIAGRVCLAIASSGRSESVIQVWDPRTGAVVRTLARPRIRRLCGVEVDGRPCLVFAATDKNADEVSVWMPSTDELIQTIRSDQRLVSDVCGLEVGGRGLVAILTSVFGLSPGQFNGGVVDLWDLSRQAKVASLAIPGASLGSLCTFRIDERVLLAVTRHEFDGEDLEGGAGSVWVADPVTGCLVGTRELHDGWVNSVCAVELGPRALVASASQVDRSVRLWTADTLRPTVEIPVRRGAYSVAQADDLLVVGLSDGGVMALALSQAAADLPAVAPRI